MAELSAATIINTRPVLCAVEEDLPLAIAHVLARRGVAGLAQAHPALSELPKPAQMKGMPEAVARLIVAIKTQERCVVVADYDADGATACAVAVRGLRAMGAVVDFVVPNRVVHGYGLTPDIVDLTLEKSPKLLITVDNGMASSAGVAHAKALGIDVLITDHHLPGDAVPECLIVNPNQVGCPFPSKNIAGVGVMFYVLIALRAALAERGEDLGLNLAKLLDLVALGTVADVVRLDGVNRSLVDQGLRRIRAGLACQGIRALLVVAGKDPARASTSDIGFALGPRINATGRLADMSVGIRCLLADHYQTALPLAQALDDYNRERKLIETDMKEGALEALDLSAAEQKSSLAVFDESWHQGVVGLLASRLKDLTHRPTIAFARASERELKGSGRSIPGLHLRDALDLVSKRAPGVIQKFGGHAMAAGLSIEAGELTRFSEAFEAVCQSLLSEEQKQKTYITDGAWPMLLFDVDLVHELNQLVWGQGFPAPSFHDKFLVKSQKIVGEKHSKLSLIRQEREGETVGTSPITALCFQHAEPMPKLIECIYRPVVNEFQGQQSVELIIEDFRAA